MSGIFERLAGAVLALMAPLVMFFTLFLAIPDFIRYRRIRAM
jgi:hypothetical protein